jgi:hypothetical protein
MIDRLRELLRAWDFETYPGPFHIEQHDHPDQWWLNNAMGDSMALDTSDAELVVNALPELLDAHDRMAGALRELIRTTDAYGEAQASRGHEGTPHDLYFHSAFSHVGDPATCLTVDDCSACMSAMYGTEAEMQMSIEAARAALAVPKEENPE